MFIRNHTLYMLVLWQKSVVWAGEHDSKGIHGVRFYLKRGSNLKISAPFLGVQ